MNYPIAMATNEIRREYGGVAALPTSFVLNSEGQVVQKHEGLRDPLLYEGETFDRSRDYRLPARVETFEDTGEIFLKHADRASDLPGVDLDRADAGTAYRRAASVQRRGLHLRLPVHARTVPDLRSRLFGQQKAAPQKSSPKFPATPPQRPRTARALTIRRSRRRSQNQRRQIRRSIAEEVRL